MIVCVVDVAGEGAACLFIAGCAASGSGAERQQRDSAPQAGTGASGGGSPGSAAPRRQEPEGEAPAPEGSISTQAGRERRRTARCTQESTSCTSSVRAAILFLHPKSAAEAARVLDYPARRPVAAPSP